jgi:hypothetical protein
LPQPSTTLVVAAWLALCAAGVATLPAPRATVASTATGTPLAPALAAELGWSGLRPLVCVTAEGDRSRLALVLDELSDVLQDDNPVDLRVVVHAPYGTEASDAAFATLRDGLPAGVAVRDRDGALTAGLGADGPGRIHVYRPVGALVFADHLVDPDGRSLGDARERLRRALLAAPEGPR